MSGDGVERIWIKTAWVREGQENPCLVVAYDEMTFEAWGKEPDFYAADVSKYLSGGDQVREALIHVNLASIRQMFEPIEVGSKVEPVLASDEGES